jgi:hypothetical protein
MGEHLYAYQYISNEIKKLSCEQILSFELSTYGNYTVILCTNVWRKSVFDIYFTEFGAVLTTVYLFCSSIVINTVIVTAGNFEP